MVQMKETRGITKISELMTLLKRHSKYDFASMKRNRFLQQRDTIIILFLDCKTSDSDLVDLDHVYNDIDFKTHF